MHKVRLVVIYGNGTLKDLYWWCWNRQMECLRYSWWNYLTEVIERKC